MDELTRFARTLVERLGAKAGNGPVSVHAIRKEILPYRAERRNLGLSSVEDYEIVLLRLVAEERGFVRTAPPGSAERCRELLAHPNPDLGALEELGESTIQFTSLAAAPVFEQADGRTGGPAERTESADSLPVRPSARPPETGPPVRPSARPPKTGPPVRPSAGPPEGCPHCQGALPPDRAVVFCPWCGERLVPLLCERCGTEFDSSWRHCITCGAPVRDPYRTG